MKKLNMKKIRKAVFPVAGFGTRFLPATKAMPKELLPIIDKPLIQYAVEEAILAGIDTLIFVTGRNKRAIEDHFDNNYELEALLRSKGQDKQAEMVKNILPQGVECMFLRQSEQLGLGHAVLCAERAVGDEPFAVILADDFIDYDEGGATTDLVNAFHETGKSQLSIMEILSADISNYGVVIPKADGQGVSGLIEKPSRKEAPSNLAIIGRYILTPDIFDILRSQNFGSGNEVQLTDALNTIASEGNINTVFLKGERFDCGSVNGYVEAILYMKKNML
jgi:UTP--glucose-1-phosphate uridylyltransferase